MIGQFLGHYRIEAEIGAGAMGVVYRAFDTRLHRTVAIKRLQHASPDVAAPRLLQEARLAATLNHPNICTIHEVGEIDGHAFIVMEYVDGRPLSAVIPAGGLPLETALEYGSQIADAVAFAHARGIVHRDLKSSNIVITREGRSKVLDFGLALRVSGRSIDELASSGATASTHLDIAGTPEYMSPEALRGESSTPCSDVWSLGVVLYEMATGRRPYDERTGFQVAAKVLSDLPIEVPATIPVHLATVIKRCLAKQPERRYRQAGEVRAALDALQHSPVRVPEEHVPAASQPRRRPNIPVLAVAAAIVIAVAVAIPPFRNLIMRTVSEPAIAFAERDWLLVSDFENRTGDPLFDRSLSTALSAALTQSRYVNVVPLSRIRESLRRMERLSDGVRDVATAREIAVREGFRLVLAPSIASTGGRYLLTASLIDPASGATLKSDTVVAETKSDMLPAIDTLSNIVRRSLGEAGAMIAAQSKPLVKVTTASLDALQRFSLGRDAHGAQQLEKARALYEDALAIDPAFTAARASLGMIHVEFFDRPKGLELLAQAVKAIDGLTDSERVSVLGFHATAVERNLEKAAGYYSAFLNTRPDSASAHNNLGRIYMQMRRFPEAVAQFQEAIRLDPDLFLAYFSLNTIYLYELGDNDSAIATAQRQLARNDRAARAYAQLGAAYAAKGDLRQAENALRKALEIDPAPRYAVDHYRLGHILRLQGRFDEARNVYLHLLEIAPTEISARYEAGAVSQLMGDGAAARKYLRSVVQESERYLKDNASDGERWLELAAAFARLGDVGRARSIARQVEPLTENLPVERAGLHVVLGDTDNALDTLERAVKNGYRNVMWVRINTDLHALQGDARLEEIVSQMR
jgi:tetratricopeptide (TPR) repeat protein/tRNA A-37 threonylcarbamoyl transferase component Bud32/TolB-like protein